MQGSSREAVGGSNGFPLEKVRSRTFSLVLAVGVGLDWGLVRWIAEGSGKLVGVVGDVRSSGAARGGIGEGVGINPSPSVGAAG